MKKDMRSKLSLIEIWPETEIKIKANPKTSSAIITIAGEKHTITIIDIIISYKNLLLYMIASGNISIPEVFSYQGTILIPRIGKFAVQLRGRNSVRLKKIYYKEGGFETIETQRTTITVTRFCRVPGQTIKSCLAEKNKEKPDLQKVASLPIPEKNTHKQERFSQRRQKMKDRT